MNEIIQSTNLSITLLKLSGGALAFFVITYFFRAYKRNKSLEAYWPKVVKTSILLGMVNAGIVIIFGQSSYIMTPFFLGISFILWLTNKFPSTWTLKYFVTFCFGFILSSVVTFFSVATLFFHLAVTGKI